jgi:hypothetical protein
MYFNHAARRNNFCLKENKKITKHATHTPHMNDDYCSQCEEKKTKQKSRKLHDALFLTRKKN